MAGCLVRQKNGLLCRYSSISDSITDFNMTDEDYIEMCKERAVEEAKEVLEGYVRTADWLKESKGFILEKDETYQELIKQKLL